MPFLQHEHFRPFINATARQMSSPSKMVTEYSQLRVYLETEHALLYRLLQRIYAQVPIFAARPAASKMLARLYETVVTALENLQASHTALVGVSAEMALEKASLYRMSRLHISDKFRAMREQVQAALYRIANRHSRPHSGWRCRNIWLKPLSRASAQSGQVGLCMVVSQ